MRATAMDGYVLVNRVTEDDFDRIVDAAGGHRLHQASDSLEGKRSDYVLNESLVELKLIEDDPLAKPERQQRLARFALESFPRSPVMVIDPSLMPDDQSLARYYRIMETPIKNAIRKASQQLEETANRVGGEPSRVLVIINNGFMALDHDEFSAIVLNRCSNDTKKIDHVIVGGVYYYSDGFDSWLIAPFEVHPLNIARPFPSYDLLRGLWGAYANDFATSVIRGQQQESGDRLPVVDQVFELDGIRFVKPAKRVGRPSDFWPNGRPRQNSTGIDACPEVGRVIPRFDASTWQQFKMRCADEADLHDTYADYCAWLRHAVRDGQHGIVPAVAIDVRFDEFVAWAGDDDCVGYAAAGVYAVGLFDMRVRDAMRRATAVSDARVTVPSFVLLRTREVGQDMANDVASISLVTNALGEANETCLMDDERVFFVHGLAIASSYAVAHNVDIVRYIRDRRFVWE